MLNKHLHFTIPVIKSDTFLKSDIKHLFELAHLFYILFLSYSLSCCCRKLINNFWLHRFENWAAQRYRIKIILLQNNMCNIWDFTKSKTAVPHELLLTNVSVRNKVLGNIVKLLTLSLILLKACTDVINSSQRYSSRTAPCISGHIHLIDTVSDGTMKGSTNITGLLNWLLN